MANWMIVMLIAVLVIGAGVAVVKAFAEEDTPSPGSTSCSYGEDCPYKGSCTGESNCGRSTCGAVNGAGGCGCGK